MVESWKNNLPKKSKYKKLLFEDGKKENFKMNK